MKTDDLVAMLATGAAPVPRRAASRRLSVALLVGVPLSFAWMLYEYGMRRDLIEAMFWPMFWVRMVLPICVGIAGFVILQRLARPGARVRKAWLGLAITLIQRPLPEKPHDIRGPEGSGLDSMPAACRT